MLMNYICVFNNYILQLLNSTSLALYNYIQMLRETSRFLHVLKCVFQLKSMFFLCLFFCKVENSPLSKSVAHNYNVIFQIHKIGQQFQ